MDRFTITYDEQGVQEKNEYIGKIAEGIIEYYNRKGIKLDRPEHCYGLIHRDEKLLRAWEDILAAEGLL